MSTPKTKTVQIFRPGTHIATNGQTLSFSADDLRRMAEHYNPTLHNAPLVVGHPATDDPAYGWCAQLTYDASRQSLEMTPQDVDPVFAEWVTTGRYKNVSACFYAPSDPANPVPGVYYLRHVGFLGAHPPSLKGLRPVEFSDGAAAGLTFVAFAETPTPDSDVYSVLERLSDVLQQLRERFPQPVHSPSETDAKGSPMDDDTLKEREAALAAREAELVRREHVAARETATAFAETLVKGGRVLPRDATPLAEFLMTLGRDSTLAYAEAGQSVAVSPRQWFESWLTRLPVQVAFGEFSAPSPTATTSAAVAHGGYPVDPKRQQLHQTALAYAAAHNCDYVTAVIALERGGVQ